MNARERIWQLRELRDNAVLHDRRLSHAEARVGWMILDRLLELNVEVALISYEEIENAVHVKRSTIKKACARLVEFGYLTVRARRGRPNQYSLPGISEVIGTTTEAQAA